MLEKRVDDLSGAIDRYAEILERTPGHRDATAALERILENPDHRYRVAVILEPIYRKAGDWQKLVAVLDAQLDTVEDRDDRVKILGEMAQIYQRLARIDLAFGCRSRAWLADVGSPQALAEMETLAVSARLYGPLVETLQKGAVEATDPDLQARLWGMTARLIEEHLGDANQAIEAWRAALAARPDDLDSFLALERLLTAAARMDELVEVLEKHLEIATDPADRKLIAKRIAVLYELALKEPERAIRAWQDVLGIDDGDVEALDALAALYQTSASWRELAEIFERKIQITQGVGDRRALRLQAANLYDDKLGESNEAVSQLRAILDESANDREALDALDRVFAREGRHADLLEVLDLRMAGESDPVAHDRLAFRAAKLVEVDLSDSEAAIARYQAILARSPAHARGARRAVGDRARQRLPVAGGRGAGSDPARRARVGRGRRAPRAALRGRGHGGGAPVGAGGDRAHRGDRAARSGQGVRGLGARADRGGDRGRAARGAGAARGRERRLPRSGGGLRGAHGGDLRRRPAALDRGAAGRAARGQARRPRARRPISCARR